MTEGVVRSAVMGVALSVLGVLLSSLLTVLEFEESIGLDLLFRLRGAIDPPPEVAIVSLSRESGDAFGLSSDVGDWPRSHHGELVSRLSAAGAASIVFDIIFETPRADDPNGDLTFAEAIEDAGNVILAERVREVSHPLASGERRIPPIEPLMRGALGSAPFVLPRFPARVNQFWTFGRSADVPSLPAVALHAYALPIHQELMAVIARVRPDQVPLLMQAGTAFHEHGLQELMQNLRRLFKEDPALAEEVRSAIGSSGAEPELAALIELYAGEDSRYLNFYGPAGSIETLPYHKVLSMEPDELRSAVGERVVFVGFSAGLTSEQQDEFLTVFSERSGRDLAGVEIGATAFANLLRMESVKPLPLALHWAAVTAWGVLIAVTVLMLRGFSLLLAGTGLSFAYAGGIYFAFEAHQLWLPVVVPLGVQLPAALLVGMAWSYSVERRQRERIHAVLGYYLPTAVVAKLAREAMRPQANRELIFGTCLVTDAERYTTVSESLEPRELGDLMNAYYDVLVEAVHRHGGVVSDLGGDSMIAVWPAVTSLESTRVPANRCARELISAVERFNRDRAHGALPTRVGLESGEFLLGNVGGSLRGEYRAVGDIVNTASRLQGLNRLLGTRILVSSSAAEAAPEFAYRPLGEFLLVGKTVPVAVQELQLDGSALRTEVNERFAEALRYLRAGEFALAEAAFESVLAQCPSDGPTRFFLEECRGLIAHRSADWDGVVRVKVK